MTHTAPAFDDLRTRLIGRVIAGGNDDYDRARALWNGSIDSRPAAIVQCAAVEDVVAAVDFARANGYEVAVRAGGHSLAGLSTRDQGLVVDLSLMNRVRIDATTRRAFAQAGALGGDLDRAAQHHGLGTTLGTVSHTGIGGLTLGGGMGWAMRRHGFACDNVRSVEAVLTDGSIVRADRDHHADLFWALRGGGGGLAVVTEFEYDLHAFGPEVALAQLAFGPEAGRQAFRVARDLARAASRERNVFLAYLPLPDDPDLPAHLAGTFVFMVMAVSFDIADADGYWLESLHELEPVFVDIGVCRYVELQTMFDEDNRHGVRAYGKGAFISELTDEAINSFAESVSHARGEALIYLQQLGGAVTDLSDEDNAAGGRSAEYVLNVIVRGTNPDEDNLRQHFARSVIAAMQPYSSAAGPVNFDGDEKQESATQTDSQNAIEERLRKIKSKYDPTELLGGLSR